MQAALVAALATVIVTLLGLFASRMESRDARSRLMKDLEIASKLKTESLAWQLMDSHIARVAQGLVDRERRRDEDRNARRLVYFGIISAFVVLALSIVREHNLGYYKPLMTVSYWMFFVYMVMFPVVGLILFIRLERQRRQRPSEQTPGRRSVTEPEQAN
jgi:Flp pilus assembly protein TadB